MSRLRYNGLSNSLGASLTDSSTAITFTSKLTYAGGDVPTISGSDYIPLSILDADGNCAEVVHLTAYTSAATTGTIARGKEDTVGVAHDSSAALTHGPTAADPGYFQYDQVSGSSTAGEVTYDGTAWADVDATNLVGSVAADEGDVLLVTFGAQVRNSNSNYWAAVGVSIGGNVVLDQAAQGSSRVMLTRTGFYVVQSADISSGEITYRLQVREIGGGDVRLLYQTNNGATPFVAVMNLGQ